MEERLRAWCLRVSSSAPLRLGSFALLALAATYPFLLQAGLLNDFRDAHYYTLYEEAARRSVLEFHQLPLWNPYYCGGLPLLGAPQSRFGSPTFLLTLVFGVLRADPLIFFVMTLLGLEGLFRYARTRGATPVAAWLAAPIFACSGLFAYAPVLEWTNFYGLQLIPWVLWGVHRALRGVPSGAATAALACGWMIGFGGTYAIPLTALLCVMEALDTVRLQRHRPRVFSRAALGSGLFVSLALGVCAFRLWPVAEFMQAAPRVLADAPRHAWSSLLRMLTMPAWSESVASNYAVGWLFFPVTWMAWRRGAWGLWLAAAICLLLATGYATPFSLFALLRRLPVYNMLRYPERFLTLLALFMAVLAALGLSRIEQRRRPRGMFAVAAFLLLANAAYLLLNHHGAGKARAANLVAPPQRHAQAFRQARGNRWLAAHTIAIDRGSLSCFDDFQVPMSSRLRGDLPAEEYLLEPQGGTVQRLAWSPNRIEVAAKLRRRARLVVNQNWHPGWRSDKGQVRSEGGMLAVDLPAGTFDVALRFLPRAELLGSLLSLLALGLCLGLLVTARPRLSLANARRSLLLALAPFLLVAPLAAWWREPAWPRRGSTAPDGETLLVEAPPPDSQPLGVRFVGGVELVAGRLSPTTLDERPALEIELDWRRARQRLPSGLGVFVHLYAADGSRVQADHVLLSSTFLLEGMPPGKIVRDRLKIDIPASAVDQAWRAEVGLWKARGDGKRLRIQQAPASVKTHQDAVGFP